MTVWKDIAEYEGRYQVSDDGQVKSLPNSRRKDERILAQAVKPPTGYKVVNFSLGGVTQMQHVHALVLEAFVSARPAGLVACHQDGDPANNHVSNLRWDTQASNISDKRRHGTESNGERNGMATLTNVEVRAIKVELGKNLARGGIARVARQFGLNPSLVGKIKRNERWSWMEAV